MRVDIVLVSDDFFLQMPALCSDCPPGLTEPLTRAVCAACQDLGPLGVR